jgi:predicted transcriptional regulator
MLGERMAISELAASENGAQKVRRLWRVISSVYIMRTLVDIPKSSLEALNAMAKAKSVSRAELVREAISDYLKVHEKKESGEGIERFAGLWGADFEDGLAYQLRLRAEWDDR